MKISILAESSNDAVVMVELASEILGESVELVEHSFQMNGWNKLPSILSAVIKKIHFHSDADGLIIQADSNHSSLLPGSANNRYEELSELVGKTVAGLSVPYGKPRIKVAVAIAAPALEAWLLFHRHAEISEAAWEAGLKQSQDPYSKASLKQWLYGVQRPSHDVMKSQRLAAARAVRDRIHELRTRFPNGFGKFFDELRCWKSLS
jgi:hypothetical protein